MVSENIYKNSEENGQWKHLKEQWRKWSVKTFTRIVEKMVSEDTKVATQDFLGQMCIKYAEGIQEEV